MIYVEEYIDGLLGGDDCFGDWEIRSLEERVRLDKRRKRITDDEFIEALETISVLRNVHESLQKLKNR